MEIRVELTDLERLDARHDVAAFDAGPTDTDGQGAWLRDHGLANDRKGLTRTFVATYVGTARVGAFFGLTPGAVERVSLPKRFRPHGTPSTIPAWLIARLAVDHPMQGRGVGRDLMLAALSRVLRAHEHGGGALVIVDAVGEPARRLYARHGFTAITETSGPGTRMAVPIATVAELLRAP